MATRPETAKKILLYWMDASVALMSFMLSMMVLASAREGRISAPHAVAAELCVLATLAFLPLILRDAYDDRPRPTAKLVAGGLFAAGAVALVPPSATTTGSWEMVGCLWLSVLALYLPLRATACVGAALVALTAFYVSAVSGQPWPYLLISLTLSAVLLPATMRLWRWLWWTIREAYDSREAKATLAVSNERLRFARDLHDLLGHSLSVLTLKSELAAKLATIDAGKAAAEMADVGRLAAESLAEVQVAVDGYRVLDLDEELAGVRAALEAAGARCVIEARTDDLSPAARTLLAWAVREGATNVLKHSTATRCEIVIDGGVLEMRNDGVPAPATSGLGAHRARPAARPGGAGCAGWPSAWRPQVARSRRPATPAGEFLLRAAVPDEGSRWRRRPAMAGELGGRRWPSSGGEPARQGALADPLQHRHRQPARPARALRAVRPVAGGLSRGPRRQRRSSCSPSWSGWPPARSGSPCRGGRRPTGILAVASVITLLLAALALIWAIPVWLGMLAPFVRRRTILILPPGRSWSSTRTSRSPSGSRSRSSSSRPFSPPSSPAASWRTCGCGAWPGTPTRARRPGPGSRCRRNACASPAT